MTAIRWQTIQALGKEYDSKCHIATYEGGALRLLGSQNCSFETRATGSMAKDYKQLRTHVGATIARLRKERGWSQEELANRLYVERESISRIERAVTLPGLDRVLDMCELFGVSMHEFFAEASILPADQALQVREILSTLSADDRAWALQLLRDLSQKIGKGGA